MEFKEFLAACRRDIARSAQYSRMLPHFCKFTINLNYPWTILAAFAGGFAQNWALMISGMGMSYALTWLKKSELLQPLPWTRLDGFPDITDDLDSSDKEFLKIICERCGIDPNDVRVRSNLASSAIAPSVTHLHPEYHLVLPTGFFRLWQEQPRVAEAMVAHEIGHILQNDVDLYLDFQRYMRFMVRRFIPIVFSAGLALWLIGLVGGSQISGELQSTLGGALSGIRDFRDYMRYRDIALPAQLAVPLSILSIVLTALLSAALVLIFRTLNRRSEAVCDRIALALTRNDGIRTALNLPEFQHAGRWSFLAPSLSWRRRKLDRLFTLVNWQPDDTTRDANATPIARSTDRRRRAPNIFAYDEKDFRPARLGLRWYALRLTLWSILALGGAFAVRHYLVTTPFLSEVRANTVASWPKSYKATAAWNGDAARVAIFNGWSETVDVRSAETGAVLARIPTSNSDLSQIDFIGDVVLIAFSNGDVQLRSSESSALLFKPVHVERLKVARLLYTFFGTSFVTADAQGKVAFWRSDGSDIVTYKSFQTAGPLRKFWLGADRSEVIASAELRPADRHFTHQIHLFNPFLGSHRTIKLATEPDHVALSADTQWMALAQQIDQSHVLKITEYQTELKLKTIDEGRAYMRLRGPVLFSPDENVLLSETGNEFMPPLALYRPPDWKPNPLPNASKLWGDIMWSDDGRFLLGSNSEGVQILKIETGELRNPIKPSKPIGVQVVSMPQRIVVANDDGVVRVYAPELTKPLVETKFDKLTCVGTSSERNSVLVVTEANSIQLNVHDGTTTVAPSKLECRKAQQDRFSFREKTFEDKLMGWQVPFSRSKEAFVLSAPVQGGYWEPSYRVVALTDRTVSLVEIKDEPGSKGRFVITIAIVGTILLCFVEFLAAIWRRRAVPF